MKNFETRSIIVTSSTLLIANIIRFCFYGGDLTNFILLASAALLMLINAIRSKEKDI